MFMDLITQQWISDSIWRGTIRLNTGGAGNYGSISTSIIHLSTLATKEALWLGQVAAQRSLIKWRPKVRITSTAEAFLGTLGDVRQLRNSISINEVQSGHMLSSYYSSQELPYMFVTYYNLLGEDQHTSSTGCSRHGDGVRGKAVWKGSVAREGQFCGGRVAR
ncbi:hypothetical protein V8E52_006711 [Russula decolorans]